MAALKEVLGSLRQLMEESGITSIVVTGPQRSGTTIAARILAEELGFRYVDEDDVEVDSRRMAEQILGEGHCVLQAPALCHCAEDLGGIVVMMRRNLDDIRASEVRVGWNCEDYERKKYWGESEASISEIKYREWDSRQRYLCRTADLDYESLRTHRLWKDKAERESFGIRQWK